MPLDWTILMFGSLPLLRTLVVVAPSSRARSGRVPRLLPVLLTPLVPLRAREVLGSSTMVVEGSWRRALAGHLARYPSTWRRRPFAFLSGGQRFHQLGLGHLLIGEPAEAGNLGQGAEACDEVLLCSAEDAGECPVNHVACGEVPREQEGEQEA